MAAWWINVLLVIWEFILGVLGEMGYILSVQFLNLGVLWELLPVYTGWFAVQFITKGEGESFADKFLNGFTILWVAFQLGSYIIEYFFTDPYIIIKSVIVAALFAYAIFIMRLTLMGKKITKYIGRIGEVSIINIAALLFIQDSLIITSFIQGIHLILAFMILYLILDFLIKRLVLLIFERTKLELPKEEEEAKPPRYEEITKPRPIPPATPPATPAKITPTQPTTPTQPVIPITPTTRPPIRTPSPPIRQLPSKPTTPPTRPINQPVTPTQPTRTPPKKREGEA